MSEQRDFIAELLDPKTQNAAFQKLLKQYQRPLYNHIRGIVIDHDDADDVLQNTFIKVFRHISGFKGDSKLFTWIYRIATNEALTFLAQKARKSGISNSELKDRIVGNLHSDPYFDSDAVSLKLQKALLTLPEKQQSVFRMKYFEDLKYEQMSEITGTSVGALKASYHHAVKKIEQYMLGD